MKTIFALITILLIALSISDANAQKLQATTYLEKNIMGTQKGVQVSASIYKNVKVSYFFQATEKFSLEKDGQNYPFHGLNFLVPVSNCGNIQIWASLRTGLVNGKYLIATPQVNTEIKIAKHFSMGISTGYRAGQASAGTFLSFNL